VSVHANDVNTWRRSTPHAPLHQSVSDLGEPLVNAVIQAHILTGDGYMSKLGNEHTDVVCDTVQYLTNCGETDILSDKDLY